MGKKWGNALGGWRTQPRKNGKFTYKKGGKTFGLTRAGAVPYVRKSLRSTTVGLNAGAQVTKGRRISTGFYFRTERTTPSDLEKKLKDIDERFTGGIVAKASPNPVLDPYVEAGVRKLQRDIVDSTIGKQHKLGGKGVGKIGTTRGGMPSYIVKLGKQPKSDRAFKASQKGKWSYNDQMSSKQWKKASKNRPQRRGKK